MLSIHNHNKEASRVRLIYQTSNQHKIESYVSRLSVMTRVAQRCQVTISVNSTNFHPSLGFSFMQIRRGTRSRGHTYFITHLRKRLIFPRLFSRAFWWLQPHGKHFRSIVPRRSCKSSRGESLGSVSFNLSSSSLRTSSFPLFPSPFSPSCRRDLVAFRVEEPSFCARGISFLLADPAGSHFILFLFLVYSPRPSSMTSALFAGPRETSGELWTQLFLLSSWSNLKSKQCVFSMRHSVSMVLLQGLFKLRRIRYLPCETD